MQPYPAAAAFNVNASWDKETFYEWLRDSTEHLIAYCTGSEVLRLFGFCHLTVYYS
jgi:hypothetical protein